MGSFYFIVPPSAYGFMVLLFRDALQNTLSWAEPKELIHNWSLIIKKHNS